MADELTITNDEQIIEVSSASNDLSVAGVIESLTIESGGITQTVTADELPLGMSSVVELVEVASPELGIVFVAEQGPAGADGDNATSDIGATEAISALKVVAVVDGEAVVGSSSNANHRGRISGIAVTAATSGNDVTVRHFGRMTDAAWNWTSKLLWVGTSGQLVQSPPASGFVQSVARVESPTTIFVWLGDVTERV